MKSRQSLVSPVLATLFVALAVGLGYHYADQTYHRPPPPDPPPPHAWPGTALLRGTLTGYTQRVMSLRTAHGSYSVILGLTAVELPTCGRLPTLRPGEALEVRVPVHGDGTLLAVMVRDVGRCPH